MYTGFYSIICLKTADSKHNVARWTLNSGQRWRFISLLHAVIWYSAKNQLSNTATKRNLLRLYENAPHLCDPIAIFHRIKGEIMFSINLFTTDIYTMLETMHPGISTTIVNYQI